MDLRTNLCTSLGLGLESGQNPERGLPGRMLRACAMVQPPPGLGPSLGPLTRFFVFLIEFLQHGGAGGDAKQQPCAGLTRLAETVWRRFRASHFRLATSPCALRSAQAHSTLCAGAYLGHSTAYGINPVSSAGRVGWDLTLGTDRTPARRLTRSLAVQWE